MKTGIYIAGLGQSFEQESLTDYATRLKNEYNYRKTGVQCEVKVEKISFAEKKQSNVARIVEQSAAGERVLYELYEFRYCETLTRKFNARNILVKNLLLFMVVVRKFPALLKRMFVPQGYNRPFQTFYLFAIFLVLAAAIILLVPACIAMLTDFTKDAAVIEFLKDFKWIAWFKNRYDLHAADLQYLTDTFVSVGAALLILAPKAKPMITTLAAELVCVQYYLENGNQSQEILGDLDLLVDYISEQSPDTKIHFHAYSFGTLIAIDYLFPFGNVPAVNVVERGEALITIGSPFEFVKAYYPNYFRHRSKVLEENIRWINIYSIADALATNFRRDAKAGEAQFGIRSDGLKPINLNYEITQIGKFSLAKFISLYSIRMHAMYWDATTSGQSCLRLLFNALEKEGLLTADKPVHGSPATEKLSPEVSL